MLKKIFLVLPIFACVFAYAQTKVKGKVIDETGQPFYAVNVLVKEFHFKEFSSVQAYTDIDGDYTINVPIGGKTLVFAFYGYFAKEVVIDSHSIINVTLEEDT